jgi:hypothetical protein
VKKTDTYVRQLVFNNQPRGGDQIAAEQVFSDMYWHYISVDYR